jgi:hypothetical protein
VKPNFVSADTVPRFRFDTEVRAFDANGGEHRFTPECHVSHPVSCTSSPNNHGLQFKERLSQLKSFFDKIEDSNVDGKPLHVANPESSMFDIISSEDFEALSAKQIQERLRCKNIVVTGMKHANVKFDKAGLRAFGTLGRVVSIQGTDIIQYHRYDTDMM